MEGSEDPGDLPVSPAPFCHCVPLKAAFVSQIRLRDSLGDFNPEPWREGNPGSVAASLTMLTMAFSAQ